ncbi:acyl-CoA dehydrogenase family protein [Antrihabitans sp. YC2-6]|uniref:acyl-CoA dehydrogenase family protein n=1 Tax=Antrihabitans sp. YC2-6 TaxID=2799498 RepID=UPI0018F46E6B|nr:acyl-CoA dehydrogenase family protein [Antrihabitans sp. YC2-6]MBJ8345885.1 acyl-CoA/acyl-ACP dehydrogenase [Antrihabitans sp. YC2-6]
MSIFSEEQLELATTVRGLLAKHCGHAAVRATIDSDLGYDEKLWNLLCRQVGVAALAIPEEFGGIGAGQIESDLVMAELGAALAPTPMLGSVILGAQSILAIGDHECCERLLPGIADGTTIAALCWAGPDGWSRPGVEIVGGKLSGAAHFVLDAENADVLVTVARDGAEIVFFEVDPAASGVTRRTARGMDPTRRFGVVSFDSAEGRRLSTADPGAVLDRIRDVAVTALAAEQVGAAARCLDETVAYTKSRVQFGRPIGSFQALKHRMADLYTLVETARSASYAATVSLANGSPTAHEDATVAKVYCSEAFTQVAADSIQLHGGIAITWEHDAHLYFKRAHGDSQLFGQPEQFVRAHQLGQVPAAQV